MPLVSDEMPPEGHSKRLFGVFAGEKRGYFLNPIIPVWREAIDGQDPIILDAVLEWQDLGPEG